MPAAETELMLFGGPFAASHTRLMGAEIDFGSLDPARIPPPWLARARATWQERVHSEYRSVQLMNQLLADSLAAGDPLDAHAGFAELLADELRHVGLCAQVVRALGAIPVAPAPPELRQPPGFLAMRPEQRALSTAISLLLVNETLSVGFIADLHARCAQAALAAVLSATLADEGEHDAFGLEYVRRALARESPAMRAQWRRVADEALAPQRSAAEAILRELPPERRRLDAWPDEREIALGLFSPQRQALVFERTQRERLVPRLRELDLLA